MTLAVKGLMMMMMMMLIIMMQMAVRIVRGSDCLSGKVIEFKINVSNFIC